MGISYIKGNYYYNNIIILLLPNLMNIKNSYLSNKSYNVKTCKKYNNSKINYQLFYSS